MCFVLKMSEPGEIANLVREEANCKLPIAVGLLVFNFFHLLLQTCLHGARCHIVAFLRRPLYISLANSPIATMSTMWLSDTQKVGVAFCSGGR